MNPSLERLLREILAALERIAERLENPAAPPYNGPVPCRRCGRSNGPICDSCAAAGN
jgi:hypothetical protein